MAVQLFQDMSLKQLLNHYIWGDEPAGIVVLQEELQRRGVDIEEIEHKVNALIRIIIEETGRYD